MKVQIKLIPENDEAYVNVQAGKILGWLEKHAHLFIANKSPVRGYVTITTHFTNPDLLKGNDYVEASN